MRSTCATEPYGADTTGEEPAAHRLGKKRLNFRWHKQLCSAQPQLEGGPKHRSS